MAGMLSIGITGLNAAQAGLSTTSHNIANASTPGYSRQVAGLSTSQTGNGQGGGVRTTGVERQYQQYLTGQLNDAQSRSSALDTHLGQISQVNNLLGDREAGLAPLMQKFFGGMQTLSASPADSAARVHLAVHGRFRCTPEVLHGRFTDEDIELTVFPNGRALVKGSQSLEHARSVYARYIGN